MPSSTAYEIQLEYVRSNLSFLALPWGLLAHSQHQQPAVIQIAALTGAYGVSLLVVMVNSALTGLVYLVSWPLSRWGLQPSRQPPRRQAIALVVAGILLTVATLVYGHATTSQPLVGDEVKISVVQGNFEQEKKWDQQYERFIMETYAGLTDQAAEDRPALIIWPETATPRAINRDWRLYGEVRGAPENFSRLMIQQPLAPIKSPGEDALRRASDEVYLSRFQAFFSLRVYTAI